MGRLGPDGGEVQPPCKFVQGLTQSGIWGRPHHIYSPIEVWQTSTTEVSLTYTRLEKLWKLREILYLFNGFKVGSEKLGFLYHPADLWRAPIFLETSRNHRQALGPSVGTSLRSPP
jgi:hypothetical protein